MGSEGYSSVIFYRDAKSVVEWAHKTLYLLITQLPGNERWFSNRCTPLGSEFTIHQNIAPAAAICGFLCQ